MEDVRRLEEETRESVKMPELKKTEGGFEYVTTHGGLKIRNSFRADRITEDDETFEEYKIRRAYTQLHYKTLKEGKLMWNSSVLGNYNKKEFNEYMSHLQKLRETKEEEKKEEPKND